MPSEANAVTLRVGRDRPVGKYVFRFKRLAFLIEIILTERDDPVSTPSVNTYLDFKSKQNKSKSYLPTGLYRLTLLPSPAGPPPIKTKQEKKKQKRKE